ncbi:MAG: Uracil-DNA glycosylase [Parcubacteria group bacterium GW2011_GWB1_35_5]|uniref:Type-4 uracil-DNA glycosylase n=1 Tax=Candidatus Zambryskibacteria bacterium RIFCSPLOWO2_01_FULL_35_19 TaxID=1802757 RepID=A0A1G2TWY9_9BACT|nr:MAG: Uracil-DNA glycosylase [Parcubacteria group bacterium GW2011_GWC1_34_10]KKP80837.1 MAG: Uracil-DNA glycosylase [Parcubacteria group bacterium GW2011_GWB1_35_5]OHB01693.1 MAG: uracil-DNA glycosylase [Candidatus Zambryskibacteria bacterium RIFCSPLOWO2_01_FULL_35_19]
MLKKIKKDKKELMRAIKDEVVALKKSPLYKYRIENKNLPVIGQGSHDAKVMFIGEAPGKNEAQTGFPFCGASGKILDELLAYIGMDREKVYITNIVKDRPPLNRDPSPEEIKIYGPFLDRQIEIIEPKIIVGLGRYSMEYIMRKFGLESKLEPISKLHGQVFETTLPYGKVKIIILYHPAVAVYNSHTKNMLKKDFELLKKL